MGVGVWGINVPVAWGFAIVNFVWWIGIGHAGTLISAILLLLRQKWRQSINRFAEAMTLFAVACAGLVSAAASGTPVVCLLAVSLPEHHGNPAAVPQPAGLGRLCGVHLFHRFAAVLVRRADSRSCNLARSGAPSALRALPTESSPWAGAARRSIGIAMRWPILLLAGLATPLVVSVHTVVSFDFAVGTRAGLALDDFSALLRGGSDLLRLRHGADPRHSRCANCTASKTSSPCVICKTWARSCWRRD